MFAKELFDISEPKFWVSLAFVSLVVLSYKKVGKLLAGVLDGHAEKIKSELDAARRLRTEAEETLSLYKQKQEEFTKEAEKILAKARADADANNARAQIELKTILDARLKHALEKIAQEEIAAINDVRNHIVHIALAAARNIIIAQEAENTSSDELINLVISDIERKIH